MAQLVQTDHISVGIDHFCFESPPWSTIAVLERVEASEQPPENKSIDNNIFSRMQYPDSRSLGSSRLHKLYKPPDKADSIEASIIVVSRQQKPRRQYSTECRSIKSSSLEAVGDSKVSSLQRVQKLRGSKSLKNNNLQRVEDSRYFRQLVQVTSRTVSISYTKKLFATPENFQRCEVRSKYDKSLAIRNILG